MVNSALALFDSFGHAPRSHAREPELRGGLLGCRRRAAGAAAAKFENVAGGGGFRLNVPLLVPPCVGEACKNSSAELLSISSSAIDASFSSATTVRVHLPYLLTEA